MGWQERKYNDDEYGGGGRGGGGGRRIIFPMPTRLTFVLILTCLILFFIQAATSSGLAMGSPLVQWGDLRFQGGKAFYQPWRWITYQYLHAGGRHIFWNLVSIYFLLPMLERVWGWKWTLAMYTAGGIVSGVGYGLLGLIWPSSGLIGASGSIFAVLGSLAAIMPDATILAMMVIPITMRLLAILYSILFVLTITGNRDFSDAAHLSGLLFGWVGCLYGGGIVKRTISSYQIGKIRREERYEQSEQESIDRILQKVSEHGMHSLRGSEKRTLRCATERQRRSDSKLARGRRA